MDLSRADLQKAYERDGFVVVPKLFGLAEVQSWKAECRRILDAVRRETAEQGGDPQKRLRSGVYVGLAQRSEVFRALARDARLLDVLEATLGPNIAFMSDKIVFKDAETDFGSPWHQDWPYWKGSHKVSVWIALDDATEENGCLRLIPGSHKSYVNHDGHADDGLGFGNRLDPAAVDEAQVVTAPLEAGGAVFFHDLTLHASHQNQSGKDRWALISTYRDAQAQEPPYEFAAAEVVRGTGTPLGLKAEA